MAIIKPTKTFEGGELKGGKATYLKPGIRSMNFNDQKYRDGVYVFVLPAYKLDLTVS